MSVCTSKDICMGTETSVGHSIGWFAQPYAPMILQMMLLYIYIYNMQIVIWTNCRISCRINLHHRSTQEVITHDSSLVVVF